MEKLIKSLFSTFTLLIILYAFLEVSFNEIAVVLSQKFDRSFKFCRNVLVDVSMRPVYAQSKKKFCFFGHPPLLMIT